MITLILTQISLILKIILSSECCCRINSQYIKIKYKFTHGKENHHSTYFTDQSNYLKKKKILIDITFLTFSIYMTLASVDLIKDILEISTLLFI